MPGSDNSFFDVLIAGGGIIGASIAWRLARQNLCVLLADARHIGAEASSAAAGMLAPGGEFDQPSPLLDLAISSLAAYDDFARDLESDTGVSIELRHTGALDIALNTAELDALARRAAAQRSSGILSRVLDCDQLRALAPSIHRDAIGAVHYPDEAAVDPAALMQALRAACLARGVVIEGNSPITALESDAFSARAVLATRTIHARAAVLAAGAWSSQIAITIDGHPHTLPRAYPIKGHLLGYRLSPGSLPLTIRHAHTYILQRADGFTIAGSSTEDIGFDRTINSQIVSDLARHATALLPALGQLQPDRVWIGFRPASCDPAPHLGRISSAPLWLAYGHYRNGILLAPATSQRLASEIAAALAHPDTGR